MKNKPQNIILYRYVIVVLFFCIHNGLRAQNNVDFCGIELNSDIVEDSMLLIRKGCVSYNPIFQTTRWFRTDEYPPDYMPKDIILHFSSKTKKVSEVFVINVLDEQDSIFKASLMKLSDKYGYPDFSYNQDYQFSIHNKRGKRIGKVIVAKDKINKKSLYLIWTDLKSHKESLKYRDSYMSDKLRLLSPIMDDNTENVLNMYITDIKKLDRKNDEEENDVYTIYAMNKEGNKFKILTCLDKQIKKRNKIIKKGKWYKLKLNLYFRGWYSRFGNEITYSKTRECVYHGHVIHIEPENSITDIYVTPNLNGLYYIKGKKFGHHK